MLDNKTREFLSTNIKGLLQDVQEWMEQRSAELREGSEFASTPAEARLFAVLRGRERTISELARVLGVSRQAVHSAVHRLIDHGVVELVAAQGSKRDKIVRITKRGESVQKMAAKNLRQIERELAKSIGKDNLELLRTLLTTHLANVAPEDQ